MKISPSEKILKGSWVSAGARVVADQTSERIGELITKHLQEIGRDSSGWDILYRDPDDGRFWELTYPESELHGGGPPQLRLVSAQEVELKYGGVNLHNS